MRGYLGARYRVATLDLTTLELMRGLAHVAPDDELAMIASWLTALKSSLSKQISYAKGFTPAPTTSTTTPTTTTG